MPTSIIHSRQYRLSWTKSRHCWGSYNNDPLQGEVDFFRALALFWQGDSVRCQALLSRALERIPVANHQARGEAELYYGIARQMSGQGGWPSRPSIKRFTMARKRQSRSHDSTRGFAHLHSFACQATCLKRFRITQRARKMGIEIGNAYVEAWTWYLEGYIHFFRYELEEAAVMF